MSEEAEQQDPGQLVERIFAEALAHRTPEERRHYLSEACGNDTGLRRQIESLIRAHENAATFLDRSATGESLDALAEQPGTVVGRYRLMDVLGEGGFGVVYRAEQTEPVKREVALKIIKLGMDTKEVIARFEAERQALAMMDHPNIAHVYDAGATDSGRPYFVMELVEGQPITDYCDQHKLSVADRLGLFLEVCAAIQHAHQRGIVHRDLKPSNVVVIEADDRAQAKVIDFGIAKSMQGRLTDKTLFTRREVLLGTPTYMSPEQLDLDADQVDTRSDVYSLGVLLYELIAGATPYENDFLRQAAFGEVHRILREVEPPKPSTRFERLGSKTTEVAECRALEPVALQRLLRGDLDWVVMQALEKEPDRRYASAAALAKDLQRHLRNEPVSAGPPGMVYRFKKFAERHRGALASAASIFLILILAVLYSVRQADRARRAEAHIESMARERPTARTTEGDNQYISGLVNVQSEAALSPDETTLAYVNWDGPDGDLFVYDLKTGARRNLTESEKHAPEDYEFCPDVFVWSPDSQWIAYAWNGGPETDSSLRAAAAQIGEIKILKPYDAEATYLPIEWTPDNQQVLCELRRTDQPKVLVLVALNNGEDRELMTYGSSGPEHPRLSPDGRYLVYAQVDESREEDPTRNIHLFDLDSGETSQLTFWPGDESSPIWAPAEGLAEM